MNLLPLSQLQTLFASLAERLGNVNKVEKSVHAGEVQLLDLVANAEPMGAVRYAQIDHTLYGG